MLLPFLIISVVVNVEEANNLIHSDIDSNPNPWYLFFLSMEVCSQFFGAVLTVLVMWIVVVRMLLVPLLRWKREEDWQDALLF